MTSAAKMAVERFRFREDVLRAAARRTRRRLAATLVAAAAAVAGVWATALRERGAGTGSLAFALGLLVVLAAFSLRGRMRRLHARWASFEIALDEGAIAREVTGFPRLELARADIAAIEERAAGLVVRGRAGAALLVPREVEGYARVREALSGWAPIARPAR